MRNRRHPGPEKKKDAVKEPLSEPIMPHTYRLTPYGKMDDSEITKFAEGYISQTGIGGIEELKRRNHALYLSLAKRGLLDGFGLAMVGLGKGWASLNDEELVREARSFIKENGISGRNNLQQTDLWLHRVLKRRGLFDEVGLKCKKVHERWGSDDRVLEMARKTIEAEGIVDRAGLKNADKSLHTKLSKRGLLDRLFAREDMSMHTVSVEGVLDALGSFNDDSGVKSP